MIKQSRKILLTGATGFLGSHILTSIIKLTNYDVVILKRSFSDINRIKDYINNCRIKMYNIDEINLSEIDWNGIDTIVHCATNYGRQEKNIENIINTNITFAINLIEMGIKYGVKYFINTDSYFNKKGLSYNYLYNYSLSKKAFELWLKFFSKQINIINLYLEHIFGENDSKSKFTSKMFDDIVIKKSKQINLTLGLQERDFIYVADVCRIYLIAIEKIKKLKGYNEFEVGTGTSVSIKYFANKIKDISKSNTVLNFGGIPYREDEIMKSQANLKELELLIGKDFRYTSLENAINNIIKYEENLLNI